MNEITDADIERALETMRHRPLVVKLTWYVAQAPTPAPGPSLSQQIWNILLEPDKTTEWKHDELKKLFTLRNLLRKWQSDLKSVFQRLKLSKKNLPKKLG